MTVTLKPNKNIVKEYQAKTDESNTTNPDPPITHPHSYTLRLMHTVKLYQNSHETLSHCHGRG